MDKTYETRLTEKLTAAGFTTAQAADLIGKTNELNQEILSESVATMQSEADKTRAAFIELGKEFFKNPKSITEIFKTNWLKYLYHFLIAFLVIFALVFLSYTDHIDRNEVGTILGGIVGYLLGNATK